MLIVLWLTFHHKPAWYKPAALDDAGLKRARRDAVNRADFVSDRMVQGAPFEVVLNEREVNEWLAALPQVWPAAHKAIPREIHRPALHFGDGVARVGFHYEKNDWQAILSAAIRITITDNREDVVVRLVDVHGGSLPLPDALLDQLLAALQDAHVGDPDASSSTRAASALGRIRSVADLEAGIRFPNRFIWFNGRRPFAIESVTVARGELRLSICPR